MTARQRNSFVQRHFGWQAACRRSRSQPVGTAIAAVDVKAVVATSDVFGMVTHHVVAVFRIGRRELRNRASTGNAGRRNGSRQHPRQQCPRTTHVAAIRRRTTEVKRERFPWGHEPERAALAERCCGGTGRADRRCVALRGSPCRCSASVCSACGRGGSGQRRHPRQSV